MVKSSQLFLLADHIKLSLLERQRAILLNVDPNSQDGQISRSLEALREGLDALESECATLDESGNSEASLLREQQQSLKSQYSDLLAQFRGGPSNTFSTGRQETLTQPNNPSLSADFANAKSAPSPSSTSRLKRTNNTSAGTSSPKSVRFTDAPSSIPQKPTKKPEATHTDEASARSALFPYQDNPSNEAYTDALPDPSNLTNEQIHTYHSQVLHEQDEQLDRLGVSIGRQRELSIQIGDELDSQVQLLDDVDESVDRNQRRLDGARKRLRGVGRKAREHWGLSIILVLICILVLLIVITK